MRFWKTVALVTCRALPEMEADEQELFTPLEKLGIAYRVVVWDDPSVPWESFDAVIIRATWDYHPQLPAFLAWIDRLEQLKCPLWNPSAMVRWNADKRYLKELGDAEASVVPTEWIGAGETFDVRAIAARHGWHEVVVKPVVSAGGHHTERVLAVAGSPRVAPYALMVQPYLPMIATDGELSLIYFAGTFSHAVRKRAAPNEFRIQEQYGGTVQACEAPAQARQAADAILRQVPGPWLYARVDGVEADGEFQLMELELIEPRLYLKHHPKAPSRFAEAIAALLP